METIHELENRILYYVWSWFGAYETEIPICVATGFDDQNVDLFTAGRAAAAVRNLVKTGHLNQNGDLLTITEKGTKELKGFYTNRWGKPAEGK